MYEFRLSGGWKSICLVVALVLIVLGILCVTQPFAVGFAVVWCAIVGLILFGSTQIFLYFQTDASLLNGWVLAHGIAMTLFGVLMLFGETSGSGMLANVETLSFLIGFFAIAGAIIRLTLALAPAAPYKTWLLVNGLCGLVIGIIFLAMPFLSWVAVGYVIGLFFILQGVAFVIEVMSAME
jgi:uncharacterized membrane protein HdeD (DUF308 family)